MPSPVPTFLVGTGSAPGCPPLRSVGSGFKPDPTERLPSFVLLSRWKIGMRRASGYALRPTLATASASLSLHPRLHCISTQLVHVYFIGAIGNADDP